MIIPHLFRVSQPNGESHFIVKIALTDYTPISTEWMDDPLLPEGKACHPSVDITLECHIFSSEAQAIKFIAEWWIFRATNLKSLKKKFKGSSGPWIDYIESEIEGMNP